MSVRSIPPITSTGSNRRKTSVLFDGLSHMSIGRNISIKRKSDDEDECWDITKYLKSDFNKKSKKKIATPFIYNAEQKIKSIIDVFYDYNDEGDIAIILEFSGFEFLRSRFNRIAGKNDICSFYIPVSYQEKVSRLYLTTNGDIFEYNINKSPDDLIYGEDIYIPELLQGYDSLSMTATLKNNWVIVTYKKTKP